MNEKSNLDSKELIKNPIERAKDILGAKDDIESYEIYSKLRDYRNNLHPDRFTDEKQKNQAEKKFKEIQELLIELAAHIQQEEMSSTPKELALYKSRYDNVYYQERLDRAEEQIEQLQFKLNELKETNQKLSAQIQTEEDKALLEEMKEIEDIYRISYKKFRPIGIFLLLTTSLAVMSKIEAVSIFIKKYAPVSQNIIDLILFMLFLVILFFVVKQWMEYRLFSFFISRYCSVKAASDFMHFLEDRYEKESEKIEYFREKDVFDFIASGPTKWKKLLAYMGVRLFQTDTIDNLKKCFINNLLYKKLIEISNAKNLDRSFKIIGTPRRRYRFDDDF